VLTTLTSYGQVAPERQADILNDLRRSTGTENTNDAEAALLRVP
jgi:hypothetical protein